MFLRRDVGEEAVVVVAVLRRWYPLGRGAVAADAGDTADAGADHGVRGRGAQRSRSAPPVRDDDDDDDNDDSLGKRLGQERW